jgi:hypothetical protein
MKDSTWGKISGDSTALSELMGTPLAEAVVDRVERLKLSREVRIVEDSNRDGFWVAFKFTHSRAYSISSSIIFDSKGRVDSMVIRLPAIEDTKSKRQELSEFVKEMRGVFIDLKLFVSDTDMVIPHVEMKEGVNMMVETAVEYVERLHDFSVKA